jgi:hypothetical protein
MVQDIKSVLSEKTLDHMKTGRCISINDMELPPRDFNKQPHLVPLSESAWKKRWRPKKPEDDPMYWDIYRLAGIE